MDKASEKLDIAIVEYSGGNKFALGDVYDISSRQIFSLAYAICCNYQDAEDVLQETMVEIARSAWRYKAGTKPFAYIMKIAKNKALDIVNKRKRTVLFGEEISSFEGEKEDDTLQKLEARELLKILSTEERAIIYLRLYIGLPFVDVAKSMDMKLATVSKKYQRAIKKLAKIRNV